MSGDSAARGAKPDSAQRQEFVEVAIEDMTLGPYGVGRVDGRAIMVANAAPGDTVAAAITQRRRDYWTARLDQLIRPGAARRTPPCPYLPRCGGCDWQQLSYPEQIAAKGRLIAREFKHGLDVKLDPDTLVEPAPAEFGYRSRVRLKTGEGGALGFFEQASKRLVSIDRCLVAGEDLCLDPARALGRALGRACAEIEIVRSDARQVLIAVLNSRVDPALVERAWKSVAGLQAVAGLVVRGKDRRITCGDPTVAIELEAGLTLHAFADAFTQVNHACNRRLIAAVMELGGIGSDIAVLDLFCGAGNFSLPAAKRGAQVMGVDADGVAIEAAQRNARELGLEQVRFSTMPVQAITPFLGRAGYRPHTVIIDPPRSGARELMKTITALDAARIVYVSCNAATLVRDLRMLIGDGYAIDAVKAFDFFPNTHHCEVLALLT